MRLILPDTPPIPLKRTRHLIAAFLLAFALIAGSPTVPAFAPGEETATPDDPNGNLGQCVGISGSQIPYPFSNYYSCTSLGTPPGVPTSFGGLTFRYDDPNTILIGGAAASSVGRIYQIGVTRDANKHITGFSGSARLYPSATSKIGQYNDGGLAFGPENVLFVTRYPDNQLEQNKPGSNTVNKLTELSPLGIAASVGSVAFLPPGFPGEGSMKLVSFTTGGWYNVNYAPDGTGTFNLSSPTLKATVPGAEGIAFVPPGSPVFPRNSALIANYSNNTIITAPLDSNGDPIMENKQTFIQGVPGPEGAAIDPVTGDFLFCTFSGGDKVIRVSGFAGAAAPTGKCHFRVLLAYADGGGRQPVELRDAIQGDPDVAAVDLFDASQGTPTLVQLQQYDIVMPFSNGPFSNSSALGDNLAAYVDGGGVVVQAGDSFAGPNSPNGINGRWLTGNYNPFGYMPDAAANGFTADITKPTHPLATGVTTLYFSILQQVTLPPGASLVASALPSGAPVIAYRPVSGGHTTVGIAAFFGMGGLSGDWGRLIVNAGRWLRPCGGTPAPTPTPSPTATVTPTATPVATPTATASATPAATPTVAPTTTPTATPTPSPARCQFRVLIAYVDFGGHIPNAMREQVRLDLDVAAVDLFDLAIGTPSLATLQQYDVVMLSSNGTPSNPAILGDNLAAYVDSGGVVVECGNSFPAARLGGRWLTGNYNPFDASTTGGGATEYGAYFHDRGHPLMAGVTTLNFSFLSGVTLPAGATRLASALPGGTPLIAYRPVSDGHTTIGIAAFLGFDDTQSGDWGKLIVNAARWLRPCGVTATPTPTATPPPSATPTATATPAATPTATPTPAPDSRLANISTRLHVEGGDNVLIAGFIVEGSTSKRLIVRGIGPSLSAFGVGDALQDPTLELFSGNTQLATNDNWPDNPNPAEIANTGLAPADPNEAALLVTLPPGAYTAVLRGKNSGTGTALIELYDLEASTGAAAATVTNISTRGFVRNGENVMIGGLIITGEAPSWVVVRALGPSLTDFGVPNALEDPFLELHGSNGEIIFTNDNWQETQASALLRTGLAPSNQKESAVVISLAPGNYTAVVRGADGGVGNGLVEFYKLGLR